jgi:transcriptional regulator with XRE-family HTH domain
MHTTLGRELKRLRIARNLRQRDIAIRVHVTPGFLSQLENDLCAPPSEEKLAKLAHVLGTETDHLLGLAGRVPADVERLLKSNPMLWALVRQAADNEIA